MDDDTQDTSDTDAAIAHLLAAMIARWASSSSTDWPASWARWGRS